MVTLRRAGPADLEAVRALVRTAYARWVPLIGREPLPMTADHAAAIAAHRVDLAEEDGILQALIETVGRPDDLLVENLAVAPASQGRGLGRRLLDHAETLAIEAGLGCVRLYTNRRFAENLAFYAQRGFAVEREEPFLGGVRVHFVKRLPRTPAAAG